MENEVIAQCMFCQSISHRIQFAVTWN